MYTEVGTATHSSILAWRIPWTEEPGGLKSVRSHRVRHDFSDLAHMHTVCIHIFICVCVPLRNTNIKQPISGPWYLQLKLLFSICKLDSCFLCKHPE